MKSNKLYLFTLALVGEITLGSVGGFVGSAWAEPAAPAGEVDSPESLRALEIGAARWMLGEIDSLKIELERAQRRESTATLKRSEWDECIAILERKIATMEATWREMSAVIDNSFNSGEAPLDIKDVEVGKALVHISELWIRELREREIDLRQLITDRRIQRRNFGVPDSELAELDRRIEEESHDLAEQSQLIKTLSDSLASYVLAPGFLPKSYTGRIDYVELWSSWKKALSAKRYDEASKLNLVLVLRYRYGR